MFFIKISRFFFSHGNLLCYTVLGGDILINTKRIGKQLKDLRVSRGWKQKDVAERVGISRPAMSNIESGKRSLTLRTLQRFCEVFSVDISYFGIETSSFDEATDLTSRVEALFMSEDLPEEKKEETPLLENKEA